MGWWKTPHADLTMGDVPLDMLEDALSKVQQAYQDGIGRLPTREEMDLAWKLVLDTDNVGEDGTEPSR